MYLSKKQFSYVRQDRRVLYGQKPRANKIKPSKSQFFLQLAKLNPPGATVSCEPHPTLFWEMNQREFQKFKLIIIFVWSSKFYFFSVYF